MSHLSLFFAWLAVLSNWCKEEKVKMVVLYNERFNAIQMEENFLFVHFSKVTLARNSGGVTLINRLLL